MITCDCAAPFIVCLRFNCVVTGYLVLARIPPLSCRVAALALRSVLLWFLHTWVNGSINTCMIFPEDVKILRIRVHNILCLHRVCLLYSGVAFRLRIRRRLPTDGVATQTHACDIAPRAQQ